MHIVITEVTNKLVFISLSPQCCSHPTGHCSDTHRGICVCVCVSVCERVGVCLCVNETMKPDTSLQILRGKPSNAAHTSG